MNALNNLWASFIGWYHDPNRILGLFDRVQRRLSSATQFHDQQNIEYTIAAAQAQTRASAHAVAASRAQNVSAKLAELLT